MKSIFFKEIASEIIVCSIISPTAGKASRPVGKDKNLQQCNNFCRAESGVVPLKTGGGCGNGKVNGKCNPTTNKKRFFG
jgi:hypothetical protein